jgi:hypothetical protein
MTYGSGVPGEYVVKGLEGLPREAYLGEAWQGVGEVGCGPEWPTHRNTRAEGLAPRKGNPPGRPGDHGSGSTRGT